MNRTGVSSVPSKHRALRVESRFGKQLLGFLQADGSALNLAVARIVVFLTLVSHAPIAQAIQFSALPSELRFPPVGLGWIDPAIPINPSAVRITAIIVVAAGLMAAAGFRTRWTGWLAVGAAVYLFGVPNYFGKVDHYHHLIWFAAIIAASPSADVLSLDALRAQRRGRMVPRNPARRYGFPIRCIWLLIGLIYFFPGFYKLLSGWGWVFSDNIRYILIDRSLLDGGPIVRIDGLPEVVLWLIAASVVVFELGIVFAIVHPRTRLLAVVSGLLFHLGTALFLDIQFRPLLLMYLVFVPWAQLATRLRSTRAGELSASLERSEAPATRTSALVGATLIFLVMFAGFAHALDGWPVALYPTFETIKTQELRRYEPVQLAAGEETPIDFRQHFPWMPGHRVAALVQRIGSDGDATRLAALWRAAGLDGADGVRVYTTKGPRISTQDNAGRLERVLLVEVTRADLR